MKQIQTKNNKNGFTLIEVIVAFLLLGIFAVITITTMSTIANIVIKSTNTNTNIQQNIISLDTNVATVSDASFTFTVDGVSSHTVIVNKYTATTDALSTLYKFDNPR